MEITLAHYLSLAAILFALGLFGIFLNRKNVIIILMSIELMLLAVNINFVDEIYIYRKQHQLNGHKNDDDIFTIEKNAKQTKSKQNRC